MYLKAFHVIKCAFRSVLTLKRKAQRSTNSRGQQPKVFSVGRGVCTPGAVRGRGLAGVARGTEYTKVSPERNQKYPVRGRRKLDWASSWSFAALMRNHSSKHTLHTLLAPAVCRRCFYGPVSSLVSLSVG